MSLAVVAGLLFDIRHAFWVSVCNPILLEFVFGALLALLRQRFGSRRSLGIAMTLAGIALDLALNSHHSHFIANGAQMIMVDAFVLQRVFTFGIAAFLLVGGIVFWSPSLAHGLGRLFVLLGNASYSSYLISGVVIEVTLRVLYKVVGHPVSIGAYVADNCLYVLFVLASGWLFYDLVEWPLLRTLQARLVRKPADYIVTSTA